MYREQEERKKKGMEAQTSLVALPLLKNCSIIALGAFNLYTRSRAVC
jgi:hypothetical protein